MGFERLLLDLGEARGLGGPWSVEVRELGTGSDPFHLPLADSALAVSAPFGTLFEPSGRWHHLLDPRTGKPAESWRAAAVRARNATTADALSTALAVAPEETAAALLRDGGGLEAWLMDKSQVLHHIKI
jgi:thiamine biosynthesis lipoprotein